ncbi:uncharacterized protein LOC113420038 [Notechis scutatus]|uniref:Uncharacterized protein LOC113420038 n=1 Tax=Notechis scutatus TaxID=8663 RepID=A0A6J1V704_9SAUR|nr:uncharacterized protein LOC113420038 [Notechis scutatus]
MCCPASDSGYRTGNLIKVAAAVYEWTTESCNSQTLSLRYVLRGSAASSSGVFAPSPHLRALDYQSASAGFALDRRLRLAVWKGDLRSRRETESGDDSRVAREKNGEKTQVGKKNISPTFSTVARFSLSVYLNPADQRWNPGKWEELPRLQVCVKVNQRGYELLEELLTYDDIFLDFFNAFLALPAFPLRLQYDRLTGRLQELDGFLLESPSHLADEASSSCYGATDAERERALSWLAQERFLPFQRTVYYLEYKLAKLLVCPLDENYPVNRYAIRGYSRQSDSTAISSIPSFPSTNQASPGIRRDDLLRCPSQTRSTPAYRAGRFTKSSGQMSLDVFLELSDILSFGQSQFEEHPSRFQHSRLRPDTGIEKRNGSSWTNAGEQVISSVHLCKTEPNQEAIEVHNTCNYKKPPSGRRQVLQFDLTETSISKEEQQCFPSGSGSAALQQLKEDVLGTRAGMEDFMEFLHNTLGSHLLNFWIDCEDIMDCTRHLEATVSLQETQLFFSSAFRDIQAKYRLAVPPAFQEQLEESVGEEETAFASLSRKQYDALRRLRSYWVPRFLIHYQRIRQLRFEPCSEVPIEEELSWSGGFPFSLPVLPAVGDQKDTVNYMKRNKDWKMRKSRKGTGSNRTLRSLNDSFETLTTIQFLEALMCDLGDGDGFLHYLTR